MLSEVALRFFSNAVYVFFFVFRSDKNMYIQARPREEILSAHSGRFSLILYEF